MKKINYKKTIKNILDGTFLTKELLVRQLPYILFLTLLTFIYISNNYKAEKVAIEIVKLQKEINQLRQESIHLASDLMYIKRHSEVVRLVREQGLALYDSDVPPKKVVVEGQ